MAISCSEIPEISAQRALIKWKSGEETLVIASALDSESQRLGWIIPLPSVPSEIGKADPGLLKTLNFCLQPEIIHDRGAAIFGYTILFFNGVFLTAIFLFRRKSFVGWAISCFVIFILLPSFAVPAAGGGVGLNVLTSSLRVEKTVHAGAYEMNVLSAQNLDDLNQWLTGNGFSPFPANARQIVTQYLERKWVFAAIKLSRDEKGANTPHPVRFVFKSPEVIYPMQLTALAGSTPQFELFVLGDQRANSRLLKTEFCDKYNQATRTNFGSSEPATTPYFAAATSRQNIGYPDIFNLMWDGCVLTKLSGTLNPEQMADDLGFRWSDFQPCQQRIYTRQGARESADILFVQFFGAFLMGSMIVGRNTIRRPNGFRKYLGTRLFPGLACCMAISLSFFFAVPQLKPGETHLVHGFARFVLRSYPQHLSNFFQRQIEDNPAILHKTEHEIGEMFSKLATADPNFYRPMFGGVSNWIQGSDITVSATPGNFTVEKRDGEVILRVYDAIGIPIIEKYKVSADVPESVLAPPTKDI